MNIIKVKYTSAMNMPEVSRSTAEEGTGAWWPSTPVDAFGFSAVQGGETLDLCLIFQKDAASSLNGLFYAERLLHERDYRNVFR